MAHEKEGLMAIKEGIVLKMEQIESDINNQIINLEKTCKCGISATISNRNKIKLSALIDISNFGY